MWCRHCQQDVPAIAQSYAGQLVCPRCDFALPRPANHGPTDQVAASTLASPDDAGIELDQCEAIEFEPVEEPAERASEILDSEQLQASLRELGRKLGRRNPAENDYTQGTALTLLQQPPASRVVPPPTNRTPEPPAAPSYSAQRTAAGWWLSALLLTSVVALAAGLAFLVWTAAFPNALVWQTALTATLAGEGGLIVGLAWMATRLWHNSRRVNRQLAGVDRQLDALHLAAEKRPYDPAYYRRVA